MVVDCLCAFVRIQAYSARVDAVSKFHYRDLSSCDLSATMVLSRKSRRPRLGLFFCSQPGRRRGRGNGIWPLASFNQRPQRPYGCSGPRVRRPTDLIPRYAEVVEASFICQRSVVNIPTMHAEYTLHVFQKRKPPNFWQ